MKRIYVTVLKIVSFFLVLLLPFCVLFAVVEKLPDQYKNTYLAELDDKYDLLCKTDGKKIIFVGGSSLPFGLRSDLIEQELPEYKAVDFGLYATLGTKLMMDLSKANIGKDDVVILSPELSAQTYSLYFNAETVLRACDGFAFKYKYLPFGDRLDLFYNYYKFALDKMKSKANNAAPDPVGIYRHDSFNGYGDIKVDRPHNIMNNGFDSTMKITTDGLLDKEFLDYVNKYCSFVRGHKAKIYFNFPPCNELAIASPETKRAEFQSGLDTELECDLLSDLEDCIMDYRYFYDTNFHLNSSGAVYYTNLLITGLKTKLGKNSSDSAQNPSITVPKPPEQSGGEVVEPPVQSTPTPFEEYRGEPNNDYLDCFEYRLVGSSYRITGVKNGYKDMEAVILPSTYKGKNITAIVSDAFYGCVKLKNVYIGKTYKTLEERAFNGCIALRGIYLYEPDGNTVSPSPNNLLDGAGRSVKIYIPNGANYSVGYTWENYRDFFEYFTVKE